MKITYDPNARAAYVQIADGFAATTQCLTANLLIDYDKSSYPIGIELLDVDLPVVEVYGMPPGAGPAGEE